jgi:hypothetical protein
VLDAHKLNIFPATLKDVSLCQFMGLGRDNICTWDQITKKFIEEYQDYYKDKERREVLFQSLFLRLKSIGSRNLKVSKRIKRGKINLQEKGS